VRFSHRLTADSVWFDEDNLGPDAGLVPLLGLAAQTRLVEIIAGKVSIRTPRIESGSANLAPKLLGVLVGMCAGADPHQRFGIGLGGQFGGGDEARPALFRGFGR
jgi:hypothetical protein